MIAFVREHDVGADAARFALIYFSNDAHVLFDFNTLKGANITADRVSQLINGLIYTGGETRIDKALELAKSSIFSTAGGYRTAYNIPKVRTHNDFCDCLRICTIQ